MDIFQVGQVQLANDIDSHEPIPLNNVVGELSETKTVPKLVRRTRFLDSDSESNCVSMHTCLYPYSEYTCMYYLT